jgi:hypothetical protein
MWGIAFLAFAHLHLTPEKSVAPVIGALLWLLACYGLVRAQPRGQARRLVVTTTAVVVALVAASVVELIADDALVSETMAAVALLATLQCFAATMAEMSYDLELHGQEMSWALTGRLLVAVDVASVGVAIAWLFNLVERRESGGFRATDVDLAPEIVAGRFVLVVWALVLVAAGAHFLYSTYRTWMWARARHDAPTPS